MDNFGVKTLTQGNCEWRYEPLNTCTAHWAEAEPAHLATTLLFRMVTPHSVEPYPLSVGNPITSSSHFSVSGALGALPVVHENTRPPSSCSRN